MKRTFFAWNEEWKQGDWLCVQVLVYWVFNQVFILDRVLELAADGAEEYKEGLELSVRAERRVDIKRFEELDEVLESHPAIYTKVLKVRFKSYMDYWETVNDIRMVNDFNALSDFCLKIWAYGF